MRFLRFLCRSTSRGRCAKQNNVYFYVSLVACDTFASNLWLLLYNYVFFFNHCFIILCLNHGVQWGTYFWCVVESLEMFVSSPYANNKWYLRINFYSTSVIWATLWSLTCQMYLRLTLIFGVRLFSNFTLKEK